MNRNKLQKLKRELLELRRAPQKARALERFAGKVGRKQVKRGREPMWESAAFPQLFVLSIPHHGGGRDIPYGTKTSILDQLEDDILAWEEKLDAEDENR